MQQVFERGGTLEVAVARPGNAGHDPAEHVAAADLVFRLRILDMDDEHVVVESPSALGRSMRLPDGVPLVGAITIGQNRWKFHTRKVSGEPTPKGEAMRLELPDSVERCLRRHTRVDVVGLNLPQVEIRPLLDPRSAAIAEAWHDEAFESFVAGRGLPGTAAPTPKVGPAFSGTLMNIGGGGIGIRVAPEESAALTRHRVFWFSVGLGGGSELPLVAAGKVVHTHLDSQQFTYAGVSFDFSSRPLHQKTVVEQIARHLQRAHSS